MRTLNRPPTLQHWSLVAAILQENERVAKLTPTQRLREIREIIEAVDNRCIHTDGPVPPTLSEMRQSEISQIYRLSKGGR